MNTFKFHQNCKKKRFIVLDLFNVKGLIFLKLFFEKIFFRLLESANDIEKSEEILEQ